MASFFYARTSNNKLFFSPIENQRLKTKPEKTSVTLGGEIDKIYIKKNLNFSIRLSPVRANKVKCSSRPN